MIQDAESNVDKLTYHLENCKLLEGKETNEVSWEYIKMVGFWQCRNVTRRGMKIMQMRNNGALFGKVKVKL